MSKRVPATDVLLLKHHLTALGLPTVKAECEQAARECAGCNVDHLGFLLRLCERELADRGRRATQRRIKAARFPQVKSLDDFDFTAQPSLNRPVVIGAENGPRSARKMDPPGFRGTPGRTGVRCLLLAVALVRGGPDRYRGPAG